MFFLLFLLHPGILLPVRGDFKGDAAEVEEEAEDVGQADGSGEAGEC